MEIRPNRRVLPPLPPWLRGGLDGFIYRLVNYGMESFGLYYGVYRAEVISTDDPNSEDSPDPMCRLTVTCPSVGDAVGTTRLAWPVVPVAGEGKGFHSLPQVGDKVLLIFEAGRLDAPLWIGGWWVRDDVSSDLRAVEQHWWGTAGGHRVMLDDSDGSETVIVEHSGGAKITMDDQGGVLIENSGGASFEIDHQGHITASNASGQKVTLGSRATEPAAKADTLATLIGNLCDAVAAITVTVPGIGASGPPINAAQVLAVKAQLSRIKSQTVELS